MIDLVNPKIGTGRAGNCLIGPSLPFGVVRLGPDIAYPQPTSGYRPGKAIIGFSHTHLSGTGGSARYGNIRVMPFTSEPRRLAVAPFYTFPATDRAWSIPVEERAHVGDYRCRFKFGVEVELSCTRRVGIHRYTFAPETQPHLLIDFASLLQSGIAPAGCSPYCEDWEMEPHGIGGSVEILNNREIAGHSEFRGGWGHLEPYTVFFFIRSREPFARFQLAGESGSLSGPVSNGLGLRTVLAYPASRRQVHLEVGISFSSFAEARRAVETESRGETMEVLRARAREAWTPWLGRVEASGGSPDQHALLATSLYRLFTSPTHRATDEVNAASGSRDFTDITCLWDSIRNANSLCHLIAPDFSADLMNSLLGHAEKTGWLPDAHIAGHFAYQQGGCSAEILFSEAARKQIPGVDYAKVLAACVRNAETPSPSPAFYGRYLDDYEGLGYLSTRVPKGSVSRHIEYTYQDWCIARLAEQLGQAALARRFDAKARRLWQLWNDESRAFLPRHPDGTWVAGVDPDHHSPDGWNDPYAYESSLRHWSFSGLHDLDGLIRRHGGAVAFGAFLDRFLETHKNKKLEKETRMHIPHLYQFVGRPKRTAELIRRSLAEMYFNAPDGLPDDEDMGCHSAYYICNAIGLYPIYGQTLYSIVPPLFQRTTLHYGNTGKSLTVVREGTGGFLQSVKLNGSLLKGTLLRHQDIANGGILELSVSDN